MLRSFVILYLLTLTIFGQIPSATKTEVVNLDLFIAHTKQPQNGKKVGLSGTTKKAFIDDKAFIQKLTLLAAGRVYPLNMLTVKREDPVLFLKFNEAEENNITDLHKSDLNTKFYLRFTRGNKEQYFETRFPNGPISTLTIIGSPDQIEALYKALKKIRINK